MISQKKQMGRWLLVFLMSAIWTPQLSAQEERTLTVSNSGNSFHFKLEKTKIVVNKQGEIEIWENNRKFPSTTLTGTGTSFSWSSPVLGLDDTKCDIRMITTRDEIQIKGLGADVFKYTIHNVNGKMLGSGESAASINISALAKGVYILRVNNQRTFKFVRL